MPTREQASSNDKTATQQMLELTTQQETSRITPRANIQHGMLSSSNMLALQRTMGNRVVQRMIASEGNRVSAPIIQRKPSSVKGSWEDSDEDAEEPEEKLQPQNTKVKGSWEDSDEDAEEPEEKLQPQNTKVKGSREDSDEDAEKPEEKLQPQTTTPIQSPTTTQITTTTNTLTPTDRRIHSLRELSRLARFCGKVKAIKNVQEVQAMYVDSSVVITGNGLGETDAIKNFFEGNVSEKINYYYEIVRYIKDDNIDSKIKETGKNNTKKLKDKEAQKELEKAREKERKYFRDIKEVIERIEADYLPQEEDIELVKELLNEFTAGGIVFREDAKKCAEFLIESKQKSIIILKGKSDVNQKWHAEQSLLVVLAYLLKSGNIPSVLTIAGAKPACDMCFKILTRHSEKFDKIYKAYTQMEWFKNEPIRSEDGNSERKEKSKTNAKDVVNADSDPAFTFDKGDHQMFLAFLKELGDILSLPSDKPKSPTST